MRTAIGFILSVGIIAAASCKTVGVSIEKGGFAEVRPQVAQEMILDSRQVIVFDTRPVADFDGPLGHIAGSVSVPLDTIETTLPTLLPYQASTVIVYGDSDEESIRAAKVFVAAGFKNVVRIAGGIRRWIDLGYKTVIAP
jgi:rhodanese-related sulfurtransferase